MGIDGEVVEANAPHKLVQTWRMLMEPQLAAEGFTHLSMDIEAVRGGVTKLTITHDLTNAPIQTALYSGEWESKGAGDWYEVLSGLKTLLETGAQLPFQNGPGKDCVFSSSRAKPNERKCHDQLRYEVPYFVSRSRFGNGRVVEN
jgi:hypothetical protein